MFRHRWMGVALALLGLAAVASATSTASASAEDVLSQAKAESEALDKAFNTHQPKAVGSLCTETADYTFLQGSSLETLEFGLISGRDQIVETIETFLQLFPSAKLTHVVRRARLVTPEVMVSDEDMEITGLGADARTDPRPGRGRPRAGRWGLEDRRGTQHLQGSPAEAVGFSAGIPCRSGSLTNTDRQGAFAPSSSRLARA